MTAESPGCGRVIGVGASMGGRYTSAMTADRVSLVIPGRNCQRTLRSCLAAVVPMLERTRLDEIVFVDDGSTDDTARIAAEFPVRCLAGSGAGRGAARNLGWRAARHPLIWFVDSDCVAEPDALSALLPHLDDPRVGCVGGSYGNMEEDSLLACLIHEEIVQRHLAMPPRVNFLATFNVIYRKSVLEEVSGFNERFLRGQDAELAWRVLEAGYELAFDIRSKVRHFHPIAWRSYLRTQRHQGYWRVFLHSAHRGHAAGDSYSSLLDHLQPPVALLGLVSLPLAFFSPTWWVPAVLMLVLWAAQLPLAWRLVRRTRRPRYFAFTLMSFLRAFWRAVGMGQGVLAALRERLRGRAETRRAVE